jgi:transposase-like protein
MKQFKNIMDFLKVFSSEEICHNFLKDVLWGKKEPAVGGSQNGKRAKISCPKCGSNHINEFADFKRNRCYDCKKTFSVRTGTIFDDSKIELQKWFMVIYLLNSTKKVIPSTQLAKEIDVTQKTAWFMLHRIREACQDDNFDLPFDGITEIDEAYLGGREGNKHSHKKGLAEKTPVLGFINRDTKKAKAMKVPSAKGYDLQEQIYKHTKEGSFLITDSYNAYDVLSWNYNHESVKHSAGEYVKSKSRVAFKIHTNSIEGFWSMVKRGIYGVYHWASAKHINKYLNEYSRKYNTKELTNSERFYNFFGKINHKITYKQLISA